MVPTLLFVCYFCHRCVVLTSAGSSENGDESSTAASISRDNISRQQTVAGHLSQTSPFITAGAETSSGAQTPTFLLHGSSSMHFEGGDDDLLLTTSTTSSYVVALTSKQILPQDEHPYLSSIQTSPNAATFPPTTFVPSLHSSTPDPISLLGHPDEGHLPESPGPADQSTTSYHIYDFRSQTSQDSSLVESDLVEDYSEMTADADNSSDSGASSEQQWNTTGLKGAGGGVKPRRTFPHFKLLHDTLTGEHRHPRNGQSHISVLLYGLGVLLLTAVTTLGVCLLLGHLRLRIKKKLDQRRRFDKSGQYERVDSVSSVVDSSFCPVDVYIDGPIEDVTVI